MDGINNTSQYKIYEACRSATEENRVTREELCRITGLTDRQVRQNVSEMRSREIRILSTPQKAGYWLASSDSEYRRFGNFYEKRAKKELFLKSKMDQFTNGQIGGLEKSK